MKKLANKGFGAAELLIIILTVAVLAGGGVVPME